LKVISVTVTFVTLCAQLTCDLLAIAKFLCCIFCQLLRQSDKDKQSVCTVGCEVWRIFRLHAGPLDDSHASDANQQHNLSLAEMK